MTGDLNGFVRARRNRSENDRFILEVVARNAMKDCPVYVDVIRVWPTNIPCFKAGSCHLFIDPPSLGSVGGTSPSVNFDALHSVARILGLRREWFQENGKMPHYDLTVLKRRMAVRLGVAELNDREMAERMNGWAAFLKRKI